MGESIFQINDKEISFQIEKDQKIKKELNKR